MLLIAFLNQKQKKKQISPKPSEGDTSVENLDLLFKVNGYPRLMFPAGAAAME